MRSLWCALSCTVLAAIADAQPVLDPTHSPPPSALVTDPKKAPGRRGTASSLPLDIAPLRNNRAFARHPRDADFNGHGHGYPAHDLPGDTFVYGGVDFAFPQYQPHGGFDNVLAQGQLLDIAPGRYLAVHMLVAAESALVSTNLTARYAGGSSATSSLTGFPWWSWPSVWSPWHYAGDLVFPFHYTNETADFNQSGIYRTVNWLDRTKDLHQLQLPNVSAGAANGPGGVTQTTRLHIFAVSVVPASESAGIVLEVQLARSTNAWLEGTDLQIFEAIILNVGTEWVLAEHDVRVSVEGVGSGITTLRPAIIKRLRPGDEARVQVGVASASTTATPQEAKLVVSGRNVSNTTHIFNATLGIHDYSATEVSIYSHATPTWFDQGKYGIFIHWGPYSVPAWGNSGRNESFAEWYWWWMNSGPNSTHERTYEYHLSTHGPNVTFDDFIQNLTASAYNPREWVELFADAGAQYFVLTAKQHDGYALFDLPANVSLRTSVAQVPHRNLVQELYDAARTHQPHLHTGAYYSLPEWFHPDYHGFGEWPGGNATNPYTNETLPYLGYVPLSDYLREKILPEMQTLAAMGTDLVWCDIGGPNLTTEFAAEYFNDARRQGRQVAINNRCGIEGDFDTASYATLQPNRKWERTASLDPFSYGYNQATPDDVYMKPQVIVTRLLEAVSMNGNFLLNVGPTAEGIIPAIQQHNLRVAGSWIKTHSEAIFNTTFWSVTPVDDQNPTIRFTQTADAFYIIATQRPNSTLVLHSPVPYVAGDQIAVLGGKSHNAIVPSHLAEDGVLTLEISEPVRAGDEFAWVFKISY